MLPVVEGEVEKKVEYDELRVAIHEVLSKLPYRQREIIKMKSGFDGEEPKTCEEIGKIFSVSRSRIQQIEKRVLMKIKFSLKLVPYTHKKLKSFLESSYRRKLTPKSPPLVIMEGSGEGSGT